MKKCVFIFILIFSSCELFFPPSVYERLLKNGLINPKDKINAIYVSPAGNDSYPGTNKTEPVKTLDIAIEKAKQYGYENIYVQAAEFVKNIGLNDPGVSITNINKLNLIGGFNSDFSKIEGITYLNGGLNTNFQIQHIIYISNSSGIRIENFKISGYHNTFLSGVGIIIYRSTNILIKNCSLFSNILEYSSPGAAAYIHSSSEVHILDSLICYNKNSALNILSIIYSSFCSIEKTDVFNNSGNRILEIVYSSNIFVGCRFYNNTNNSSGAFYYNMNTNITISGEIFYNYQSGANVDVSFLHLVQNVNSKLINLYMISNSYNSAYYQTNYLTINAETNLLIQNCTFIGFGPASNETAIYEYVDVTNHRIISNRFRNLKNLYYDPGYGYIDFNNISELNDKDKTEALEAYGNITF
ncbi:MAG: right-handed parallel beta-helix repeat-containing protein [Brevinematales bacterium]|nr:right-handed parallel beta-helix repeat-containing protein [Brevinematales bacterium]